MKAASDGLEVGFVVWTLEKPKLPNYSTSPLTKTDTDLAGQVICLETTISDTAIY